MARKTTELRGKLRVLTITGFTLVSLVIGGVVALFMLDIEDETSGRSVFSSLSINIEMEKMITGRMKMLM